MQKCVSKSIRLLLTPLWRLPSVLLLWLICFLVLWRTSKLLRQMAETYGASLGQLRSLMLIKQAYLPLCYGQAVLSWHWIWALICWGLN